MVVHGSLLRRLIAGVTAAAAVLALAACASAEGSSGDDRSAAGGTMTRATTTPAPTIAAKDAAWSGDSIYLQAVYDTLLRTSTDGTVEPSLATKWSYNTAGTELTLTLRTGVTFTDGTKFTAQVAADNLNRFRQGASPNKSYLAGVTSVTSSGVDTVRLALAAPNPTLLNALAQNPGLQESPKNFDSPNEKTTPVGSGPYILDTKATVVGSSYVFTKNPKYWNPKDVHYNKLVLNVFEDTTALLNAVKGGQVNGAPVADASVVDQVKGAGFTLSPVQLDFFGLILFDRAGTTNKALADVRVRQAINYALDRKALLKAIGKGYGQPTAQVFPPQSAGYVKSLDAAYAYDPQKAKDLLKAAGYAPGSITLVQPQSDWFSSAEYALFKQYLDAVGINVTYENVAGSQFLSTLLGAKYGSTLMSLKAASTPWETMNLDVLPTASWNPFRYEDPKVTAWAKTIQTGSADEAKKAAQELNRYVVQQAWFAPAYRPQQSYATDSVTTVKVQKTNFYPYLWNFRPSK